MVWDGDGVMRFRVGVLGISCCLGFMVWGLGLLSFRVLGRWGSWILELQGCRGLGFKVEGFRDSEFEGLRFKDLGLYGLRALEG